MAGQHTEAACAPLFLTGRVRMTLAIQALHEPYAHLYVGDYFTDTLDLSAHEHCALRLLLLETWVRGPVGNPRLARVAGLTKEEWQAIKPAVLPLLRGVQPRIVESLNYIRTFDGQRLPSADWHIVRSIVMERDRYACTYCGSDRQLEADHILPLSRGGSNAFVNLATACRSCNLSKGSKDLPSCVRRPYDRQTRLRYGPRRRTHHRHRHRGLA